MSRPTIDGRKNGTCKRCGEQTSKYRAGYATYCKTCNSNEKKCKAYGLTFTQVEQMMLIDSCQACGDDVGGLTQHIDHCHVTGKVRGILCNNCNNALGRLQDDPERILCLHKYIIDNG